MLKIEVWIKILPDNGGALKFLTLEEVERTYGAEMKLKGSYVHGRVKLSHNGVALFEEECELDYFFSCIQFATEEIFSGASVQIDTSYFKFGICVSGESVVISKGTRELRLGRREFVSGFVNSTGAYYRTLARVHTNQQNYVELGELLWSWN